MRGSSVALTVPLLLIFTGSTSTRAEEARSGSGAIMRAGSVVGFAEFAGYEVSVIGGRLALGQRLGPLSLEVHYDAVEMSDAGPLDNVTRGALQRYGVAARTDLASWRFARASFLRLWVEGGAGWQRARWDDGPEVRRTDVLAGAGWTLDFLGPRPHRGLPAAWGWNFGWRFMATDGDRGTAMVLPACRRSAECLPPRTPPAHDLTVTLASELVMTW